MLKNDKEQKVKVCPNCGGQVGTRGRCSTCGYQQINQSLTAGQHRAQQAFERARRRALWQRMYHTIDGLFNFNLPEFVSFLRTASKWLLLGTIVGILAGTASAIFLISLAWATEVRVENPYLLFFLPFAGFIAGWFYWRFGGTASKGNNLVIDEVNNNQSRIPLRMAPFVLIGTIITHFFGGSAGREGTAIQMGASLADSVQRLLRLTPTDRRLMIMAGIAGGFGSVFGVPAAGFVFGMEVQNVGRIRYEGIIPCMVASFIGDYVTRLWGAHHSHYPTMEAMGVDPLLMLKVAVAGVAFGLTSMLFIELVHGIKHFLGRITTWSPLYPVIGGVAIIIMTFIVGTNDYLGLSLPLISDSVTGTGVVTFAFLLKLLFTTVTLGSGYYGGEVTPLLVIGSTLGFTMGRLLGVDPAFMASIGLVAVFAGASNTPLASAIMGIELVGGGAPLYIFLGCTVAYLASGHRGIYATQLVAFPKSFGFDVQDGDNLQAIAARQQGWLPTLAGIETQFESQLVRSIMSRDIISVRETTLLSDIVSLASREGIRSIPVLNTDNVLVGMITDNDLHRTGLKANFTMLQHMSQEQRLHEIGEYESFTAHSIMTTELATVRETDSISTAIDILNTHQLKRLPVIDGNHHLLGMLTRSDILREIVAHDILAVGEASVWHITLEDIVLESVHTVTQDQSIHHVIRTMLEANTKRVIVMDKADILGIVTQNDLLQATTMNERNQLINVLQGELSLNDVVFTQSVIDVMTSPVIVTNVNTRVYIALKSLIGNQIKQLPVTDKDGQLLGMVGRAEILNALFNHE